MTTHIVLVSFTERGIQEIKASPDRAAKFVDAASGMGVEVDGLYWTSGTFDGVLLMTAPDDASASAATLSLGRGGFVRTQTLRAFDRETIGTVLSKL